MSAPLVEPSACRWCGIAQRGHGRQFADAAGWHAWVLPTNAQVLARMQARRLALTVARVGALPMPVGPQALSSERLTEIVESHPGDWYSGEWRSQDVDSTDDEVGHYVVKHQASGTVLAELPDWAGPIALFIADAHDAVPELVAEIRRLRAEVAELRAERHVTNEALDDAVQDLRARQGGPVEADGITRRIAPVQALREAEPEGEHYPAVHHGYLVPRDLPPLDGAR